MNVAQREQPATTVVLYPADGQGEVPLSFGEGEVPNPLTRDPDGRAGFPISVTFFQAASGMPRLRGGRAILRDDRGERVPVHLHLPDSPLVPGYGEDTIGLSPRIHSAPAPGIRWRWRRS
ncbi:MAG: hypothetical protein M3Y59_00845 [Myxococcota bacterium]|nr:hypothetical protein [Myxococcota bacterium]